MDDPLSLDRWRRNWTELEALEPDQALFPSLIDAYQEPHRHYHTLSHIEQCLRHLDGQPAERPEEIRVALWFHDAIYDPRREDNEARSAEWARTALLAAGVPLERAARVHSLIMATRHDGEARTADEALLVDIDLSILGAEPGRYDEYAREIRTEYAWVTEPMYAHGRSRVLSGFLARESIYATSSFRASHEAAARANFLRELERLARGS